MERLINNLQGSQKMEKKLQQPEGAHVTLTVRQLGETVMREVILTFKTLP